MPILGENKYTAFVSSSSIRFTLEFKEMFMERRQGGVPARRIFQEAGYDVGILGTCRIKNFAKRIPKEAAAPCGLHEGYQTHRERPGNTDYGRMPRKKPWLACSARSCICARSLTFKK